MEERLPECRDMCEEAPVSRYQSDVPPHGKEIEAWPSRMAWSALMPKGCVAGAGAELEDASGVL
jgi:hypothetical protein